MATIQVVDISQANVKGIKLYKSGGVPNVIAKILKDTESWPKTVQAMRKTYNLGLRLDVKGI